VCKNRILKNSKNTDKKYEIKQQQKKEHSNKPASEY